MENTSLEIAKNQPTMNIGTIGHVAHGKSTLVRAISGKKTVKFKSELERNITIKLGYANAKIYKCNKCPRPECYQSQVEELKCGNTDCDGNLELVKHVSFIDCPGHDVLMTTMISGASIMDNSLLLVAANERCPQPQTKEHLFAVELMNMERHNHKSKVLVIQNKIDLVKREQALVQYDDIKNFLVGSFAANSHIVPVVAEKKINVSAVLDFIVNSFTERTRNLDKTKMVIIRSFDINKQGVYFDSLKENDDKNLLKGGVIGGSLYSGFLKLNQHVEIRPGKIIELEDDYEDVCCSDQKRFLARPFITKIVSLKSEETSLEKAYPGGLIAVGTDYNPYFFKGDGLAGMVLGIPGKMPDVYSKIAVRHTLFKKILTYEISPITIKETLLLNINSSTTVAISVDQCSCISDTAEGVVFFNLVNPVCLEINDRIAISRKINRRWRLIGYGNIVDGLKVKVE